MAQTYLNGRITLSSLAAPTESDKEKLAMLSEADRKALLLEAIERGKSSGVSADSLDEILQSALNKARAHLNRQDNVL